MYLIKTFPDITLNDFASKKFSTMLWYQNQQMQPALYSIAKGKANLGEMESAIGRISD